MSNEEEGCTPVTDTQVSDKSRCSDCRFRSSNGRQLYSLSWPVHFVLRLAKRAYPHWHADASGRSFQSSGWTVASRALQAHHHGINCWSPELKIIHGKVENANKMKHFTKALLHNLERRLWRCGFRWFLGSARFLWLFMKTRLSKPSREKDPKLKELPDCNIIVKTFTWVNYFSL